VTDVVTPSDFRQSFPSIPSSDRFCNLMLRQLGLSPELYSPRHCPGPTLTCPREDQRAFEFSQAPPGPSASACRAVWWYLPRDRREIGSRLPFPRPSPGRSGDHGCSAPVAVATPHFRVLISAASGPTLLGPSVWRNSESRSDVHATASVHCRLFGSAAAKRSLSSKALS
jgi:hypothetical protein